MADNENINSKEYWEEEWSERNEGGWISSKLRYQLLAQIAPRYVLATKPKKKYYTHVARLVEGKFCDLACGLGITGGIYSVLTGGKTFGVDHSLEGVKFGRDEAGRFGAKCCFSVGDLYHLGIKNNYFDTVYMGQVLEHLTDERGALAEGVRILKNGGKLIISVPKEDRPYNPEHINIYTKESLSHLLSEFGAEKFEFHDVDPRRYVVSCRIKKH